MEQLSKHQERLVKFNELLKENKDYAAQINQLNLENKKNVFLPDISELVRTMSK